MAKGWYGEGYKHSMASKGLRSNGVEHRAGYPDFSKYRVGFVNSNGSEEYIFFDDMYKAYDEFMNIRSQGNEVWIGQFDKDEEDYETVVSYDPDADEDDNWWDELNYAKEIAMEYNIKLTDDYVKELLILFADNNINETTLRDRLYEYENEMKASGKYDFLNEEKEYLGSHRDEVMDNAWHMARDRIRSRGGDVDRETASEMKKVLTENGYEHYVRWV